MRVIYKSRIGARADEIKVVKTIACKLCAAIAIAIARKSSRRADLKVPSDEISSLLEDSSINGMTWN